MCSAKETKVRWAVGGAEIPSYLRHKSAFVDMLDAMRWGQMSAEFIPKLHQLSREVVYLDGIGPTEL
jgi:hypothetical protein